MAHRPRRDDWLGRHGRSLAVRVEDRRIGDFNGDNTSDILWQSQTDGLVGAWLINRGAMTGWAGMGAVSLSAWKLIGVGDFNGDNTSDVLWQSQTDGLVGAWLINSGAISGWAGLGVVSPTEWKVVGAGDYNANGTSDVLWHNQTTGLIGAWLVQTGGFTWAGLGAVDPTTWQVLGGADFDTTNLWADQVAADLMTSILEAGARKTV